jgi:ATP-dependent Clp protease ATP-binding subunit ClpC
LRKESIANFLTGSKVYSESVRQDSEHLIRPQKSELSGAEIPLTPRVRKAFQIAGKEAARFHQPLVSAEHVLLGLVLEGSGLGAMILKKTGI